MQRKVSWQVWSARRAWPLSVLGAMALLLGSGLPVQAQDEDTADDGVVIFEGTCGASAGISLRPERIVVGSDDDNFIRTYDPSTGGAPVGVQNFYTHTKVNQYSRRNFSAIEGVARIGDLVYWTASHGREKQGKNRPNRRRLFATRVVSKKGTPLLIPHGQPIMDITSQIEASSVLKSTNLGRAIILWNKQIEALAPEKRGLDIQGLAAGRDGKSLLLALRNPLIGPNAILIPLLNPKEAITGQSVEFGEPILLKLDRAGIASIEWVEALQSYLLIANKVGAHEGFSLYRWSGDPAETPVRVQELPNDLNAEGMIVAQDGKSLLLLSDDSDLLMAVKAQPECSRTFQTEGFCPCEALRDSSRWQFRGQRVPIDLEAFNQAKPTAPSAPMAPQIVD